MLHVEELTAECGPGTPGVAVLVLRGGVEGFRLIRGMANVEAGAPISIHTAFDAGSIAKTVTGLCVAMLEDAGELSPAASIRDSLPELPAYASSITLENLLRHESGLHSYFALLYYMAGWHPRKPPTSQQVLETLCRAPGPKWAPGSRYEYTDTNYFLLARAVERIAGIPFGALAQEMLFQPLGMTDSFMTDAGTRADAKLAKGYAPYPIELRSPHAFRTAWDEGHYPVGHRYQHTGAEGFRTSIADIAALAGEILAPSLIDPKTMARATAPSRIRPGGLGYGYGLNTGTYLGLSFQGHDGRIQGFTASLSVFPEHALAITCLTNREDLGAWTCRNLILKDLLGAEPRREPSRLRASGPSPEPRPGFYLDPTTSSYLELTLHDGRPHAAVNGEGPKPIDYEARSPSGATPGAGAIDVHQGSEIQTFVPFVESKHEPRADSCAGKYVCEALRTTFHVDVTAAGLRLTNADPARPSMDLEYTPTIRGFFRSLDPYPGVSQLEFLRRGERVVAFRYRDYDGDGREAFVFRRA